MVQDLPPIGGYAPIQYKRNIPARGLRPVYYLAGVLGICTFGFYKWAQSSRELQELAREKVWARLHLIPLLEAENDRDLVRRQIAEAERERALMSDVKGWKMGSVYNSDKVIRPRYGYGPDEELKGKSA